MKLVGLFFTPSLLQFWKPFVGFLEMVTSSESNILAVNCREMDRGVLRVQGVWTVLRNERTVQ